MRYKGFTLIEVTVTLALLVLIFVFGTILLKDQQKEGKKIEAANAAASLIRQFLDLRRKVVEAGTAIAFTRFDNTRLLNPNDFSSCAEGSTGCQETFGSIKITANATPCGPIEETITVDCVPRNVKVPPVDLKQLPGPGPSIFASCVPDRCMSSNGVLGGSRTVGGEQVDEMPRIKVVRKIKKRDKDTQACLNDFQEVVTYFPEEEEGFSSSGLNGKPVAAAVCLQVPAGYHFELAGVHCGTPGTENQRPPDCIDCELPKTQYPHNRQDAWSENCPLYRDFNLSVFFVSRYAEDKFDLSQQVANFPRPKIFDPNAPKIMGTAGK